MRARSPALLSMPERLGALAIALAIGFAAESAASAAPPLFAGRLTDETFDARRVGGSDAIAGVGDFAIGNGTLCAVVSDPAHESQLSVRGGTLVDLGHCGADDDEWVIVQSLGNLSRRNVLAVREVAVGAAGDDGHVSLVSRGGMMGLSVETTYRLDLDRPDALSIVTRIERIPNAPDAERAFLFGDVVLHGRRQLAPFTLALPDGATERSLPPLALGSTGFAHPAVDPDDLPRMLAAIVPANFHALVGGDAFSPGIAYGLRLVRATFEGAAGARRPVPFLSINGESFTLVGVFANPVWIGGGGMGLFELAQTVFMDLAPGERLELEREILVGRRADVASVTDQVWTRAPTVRGTTDPSARVHVALPDGTPVTEVRPDADGAFAFRVPTGRYALRVPAAGGRESVREIDVPAAGVDLGALSVGAPARVALPRGRPMRLVFVPAAGGPAPRVGDDLLGFTVGGTPYDSGLQSDSVSLGGVDGDPTEVVLPPGRYAVYATRGPEFSVTRTDVDARAGEVAPLVVESPVRVVSQPGWIGADLHVHAAESDDSSLPLERRIAAFAAEGTDLIVSTEHDRVTDYGPLIERLGLSADVASMVGVEITSTVHGGDAPYTIGHANAYPLDPEPRAYRGGAPYAEGRRLRAVVGDVRARHPRALVQLNHPRSLSGEVADLNFFTHLSVVGRPFEPTRPLAEPPNAALVERDPSNGLRDVDFDVIELMNGESMPRYRTTRADWFSLLLQGEFRAAVANSDSHVASELVALPRTYVRMPLGDAVGPTAFDEDAFVDALRAGRAYGTTGPILAVALRGDDGRAIGIGETFRGASATLEVDVRAAEWVPVSRVRVFRNAESIHDGPIAVGEPFRLPLAFDRDAFVTVEVSGEPGDVYAAVAPGFEPFAFTNPLFVDADADGEVAMPGLPTAPPPSLRPAPPP